MTPLKRDAQESSAIRLRETNVTHINFFQTLTAVSIDEDQYFCIAHSRLGSDTQSVRVRVKGEYEL